MPDAAPRSAKLGILRAGDSVRVRSRDEILATLDDTGSIDGLPFMPEMLEFAGKQLRVYSRADKTCDTIEKTGTTREMSQAVHLIGARCDGSAHGGCQAGCMLYFKEEWLRNAGATQREIPAPQERAETPPSIDALERATQQPTPDSAIVYRCQATEQLRATTPISSRAWHQYVRDVRTGNVSWLTVVRGLAISIFNKYQWDSRKRLPSWLLLFGGKRYPFFAGKGTGERTPLLHLQPGELVEVRSREEIEATLGPDNTNRGMSFDTEMMPYVGQQVRVARKVDRIIDEQTGRMMKLSDCVVLEGVVCEGVYHRFCRRAITPYWREAWLRRVEEPVGQATTAAR